MSATSTPSRTHRCGRTRTDDQKCAGGRELGCTNPAVRLRMIPVPAQRHSRHLHALRSACTSMHATQRPLEPCVAVSCSTSESQEGSFRVVLRDHLLAQGVCRRARTPSRYCHHILHKKMDLHRRCDEHAPPPADSRTASSLHSERSWSVPHRPLPP